MKKHLTDKELSEQLNSLMVIYDTREQKNEHIIDWFNSKKIQNKRQKLNTGDYTFEYNGLCYSDEFVVERKNSIDELVMCFTTDRDRFEAELTRAKAFNQRLYLLIENGSLNDIKQHNYISKAEPKSILSTLFSWQAKYDFNCCFCDSRISAYVIYSLFYYYLRNKLKE